VREDSFGLGSGPKVGSFWPLQRSDSGEGGDVAWRNDSAGLGGDVGALLKRNVGLVRHPSAPTSNLPAMMPHWPGDRLGRQAGASPQEASWRRTAGWPVRAGWGGGQPLGGSWPGGKNRLAACGVHRGPMGLDSNPAAPFAWTGPRSRRQARGDGEDRSPQRSPGKGSRMPVKGRKRRGWDYPPKAVGRGLNGPCSAELAEERRERVMACPVFSVCLSNFNKLDH